jgi:hypothetical protein
MWPVIEHMVSGPTSIVLVEIIVNYIPTSILYNQLYLLNPYWASN